MWCVPLQGTGAMEVRQQASHDIVELFHAVLQSYCIAVKHAQQG
jgi:hypothetical protein